MWDHLPFVVKECIFRALCFSGQLSMLKKWGIISIAKVLQLMIKALYGGKKWKTYLLWIIR